LQDDGKILITGSDLNNAFIVYRFNVDGSPDLTFGIEGKVVFFTSVIGSALAIAVQPDQKILIGGCTEDSNVNFTLIRLNVDGTLDAGFGSGGIVVTHLTPGNDYVIQSLAVQPDHKVVAAGWCNAPGPSDGLIMARYNADGSSDSTFDTDGFVTGKFDYNWNDIFNKVLLLPDGKLIGAGMGTFASALGHRQHALIKYFPDGTIDNTFGSLGRAHTLITPNGAECNDAVLQPNGKIITVGPSYNADASSNFGLARFNPDGSIDSTFNGTGCVSTSVAGYSSAQNFSVALQNGNIITAGVASNGGENSDFVIMRYYLNGSVDSSFGLNGVITTDFFGLGETVYSIAIQNDGKIIAGGFADSDSGLAVAMARYYPDLLGVDRYFMNKEIKLFPNPNNGAFTLQLPGPIASKVFVMDVLGNMVLEKTNSSDSAVNINLYSASKGIYFVSVVYENTRFVSRVVVE
jgi:uncharacterized delta-60 repeat protein